MLMALFLIYVFSSYSTLLHLVYDLRAITRKKHDRLSQQQLGFSFCVRVVATASERTLGVKRRHVRPTERQKPQR